MIFKVLYQQDLKEVPVRERTHSMYIEANSELEVRRKLASKKYNIEYIFPVDGEYLEFEKLNENFKVENF